ncbi:nitronate monooxygenase [Rapidithrix thailandica]|uniref:Nitronate monooxygenase n=1 Tax=Rapidithrix thailandica TaxID=413964 RepID=A0AAW9RSK3_9BACT
MKMEKIDTTLTRMLGIRYPIIMAPMFLVSNTAMSIAAIQQGITAAIPALNYRTEEEFKSAIRQIKAQAKGPIGINLIVNKSNFRMKKDLQTCLDLHVDFIITSLGSPKEVIRACKKEGIKVFCDVTEETYGRKVEDLGADALIAVNNQAGGHAGKLSPEELISILIKTCEIPVISAGGVGNGQQWKKVLELGACGVSMGSPFIASHEAAVSQEYKEAIVQYGAKDIVMTTKLSGTPCTVINTPYVQKVGTDQSWLEKLLNNNKKLKKFAKMLTFRKGMKSLEKAAFNTTYKTVWCAGPSIEFVKEIRPVSEIIAAMVEEYEAVPQ